MRPELVTENRAYRDAYERVLGTLDRCDLFSLRNALGQAEYAMRESMKRGRPTEKVEGAYEAIVSKLIFKDPPQITDTAGKRWA